MAVTVRLSNGDKVAGTIVDGKTYLADGSRVPVNSIVDTGAGGVWKMTENGGVKATDEDLGLTTIYGGSSSGSSSGSSTTSNVYNLNDYLNNRTAGLKGLDLANMYGITYDQNKILDVYNQATDAQYALKQKEAQALENQYYQNLYGTQNSTIDALRAQRNSQISSGMSAGLAAAADSATAMGIQAEGAAGALELANQRQTMADELAAAYAENIVSALEESNAQRTNIANLDASLYEADVTADTSLAALIGELDATQTGYQANLDSIKAAAEQNELDRIATAKQNKLDRANASLIASINASGYGSGNDTTVEGLDAAELLAKHTDQYGIIDLLTLRTDLAGSNLDSAQINQIISDAEKQNKQTVQNSKDQKNAIHADLQQATSQDNLTPLSPSAELLRALNDVFTSPVNKRTKAAGK